jgi:hypothetical protein
MRSFTFAFSLLAILAFSAAPAFAEHFDNEDFCPAFPNHPHCSGDGDGDSDGGNTNTNTGTNTGTFTGTQTGTNTGTNTGTFTGTQTGTVSPTISPTFSPTLSPKFIVSPTSGVQIGNFGNDEDSDCYDCEDNETSYGDVLSPSSDQEQDQKQKQGQIAAQGQFGYIDSHDVTTYEAQERNPVSSAAPVSASACSSGVSAQGVDLGGAVAVTNIYCNLALTAEVAKANGKTEIASEMVTLMRDMAVSDAKGIGGFRTVLRSLPILGGTLFRWIF